MPYVPDSTEIEERCLCPRCPSFPKEGILYCARGKSLKPVTSSGCICGDCANFREYDLLTYFYCLSGPAGKGVV